MLPLSCYPLVDRRLRTYARTHRHASPRTACPCAHPPSPLALTCALALRACRCCRQVEESKCNGLTASALPLLAAAIGPLSPEEAASGGGDSGEGEGEAIGEGAGGQSGHAKKKRRAEDSLSSGLIIAARMQDAHAKRRALAGFASHYAAVGDAEQAREFSEMLTEFGAQADAERDAAREGGAYTKLMSMAMAPPAPQSLR